MRRLFKFGTMELWLATVSSIPEMRPYEIASPDVTLRLRRNLLRRNVRRIRELFRNREDSRHDH